MFSFHDWSETEFVTPVIGERIKGIPTIAVADLLMKLHDWQHKWQNEWTHHDIETEETFPGFGKMNQTIVRPEEREVYDVESPENTLYKFPTFTRKLPTENTLTQRGVLDLSNRVKMETSLRGLKY